MQKKDLKTGMVVEYRDGQLRLVVGDDLYDDDGSKMSFLSSFKDDLRSSYNTDIVAVYNDFEKSKCLWKRNEITKKDLKNGAVVKTQEGNYYLKVDNILINEVLPNASLV